MKYAFIDLHMHTKYSNEENCEISVRGIFNGAVERIKKYNLQGKACISIADHNTMLGCLEAKKYLENPQFEFGDKIEFINGIEFTTSLKELNLFNKNGKPLFTRCHILGYGFDENNKNMIAYSKLTHKTFADCNIGMQILALREYWENLGIKIEFSEFESILDKKYYSDFIEGFYNLLRGKCTQSEFDKLKPICEDFITTSYNRDATAKGRLLLSEVSKLIKDAGGYMVLAHPAMIAYDKKPIYKISDSSSCKKAYIKLIDEIQRVTNNGLSGLETFFSGAFFGDTFNILTDVARAKNLFLTAGSDYHGPIMHKNRRVGDCFEPRLLEYIKKVKGVNELENYRMHLVASVLTDKIRGDNVTGKYLLKDTKGKYYNLKECKSFFAGERKQYVAHKQETASQQSEKEVEKQIKNLLKVAERFDKLIENIDSPNKNKYFLDLNVFISSIYRAFKKYNKYAHMNQTALKSPEHQELKEKFIELKKKYRDLKTFNPGLLKQGAIDMNYYYNESEPLAIDRFFDLQL